MQAGRLSSGQQRLCLTRTLALEPEVLLPDEPTASLDVHTTDWRDSQSLTFREIEGASFREPLKVHGKEAPDVG
jgi:ABC-type sulfate/molybdate transport systems ATPase subunit